MTVSQVEVDALVSYCRSNLGEKDLWITPEGYPNSLALCIIDSIYSTGSHYTSVVNVINRYRAAHGQRDGAAALLESISAAGGARAWANSVAGNLKPAHTKPGAPLKAEVIGQAAALMLKHGIDTVEDLVLAVETSPQGNPVHDAWKKLPSQGSGVTYSYLLLLAGLPSVKPDRMVLRFLERALGTGVPMTTDRAFELVMAAADRLEVSPRTLDHVIWRAASGRDLTDQTL
ncbi:MAG: hypothetical protein L0G85_00230 [Kocuria sp.]|nr:hypothetical protein [Kocuria sp.]